MLAAPRVYVTVGDDPTDTVDAPPIFDAPVLLAEVLTYHCTTTVPILTPVFAQLDTLKVAETGLSVLVEIPEQ